MTNICNAEIEYIIKKSSKSFNEIEHEFLKALDELDKIVFVLDKRATAHKC